MRCCYQILCESECQGPVWLGECAGKTHRYYGGTFDAGEVKFVCPFDSVWHAVVEQGSYSEPIDISASCSLLPPDRGTLSTIALDAPTSVKKHCCGKHPMKSRGGRHIPVIGSHLDPCPTNPIRGSIQGLHPPSTGTALGKIFVQTPSPGLLPASSLPS